MGNKYNFRMNLLSVILHKVCVWYIPQRMFDGCVCDLVT